MKTLFDADILMENPNNKVYSEKIKNIKPNVPYYIEHSIYFAETLSVFQDETKTIPLVLGADYEHAQFDSIATEQSNKDCCRAILFLRPFPAVYIDYHSYGDLITADLFNGVFTDVTELNRRTKQIKTDLQDLSENVKAHIGNTKPHAANESVTPETLALRSSSGTLKAAEAVRPEELTTLLQVKRKTEKIKTETEAQIAKTKEQLEEKIETRIAELINNAPSELDTLKELGDALNKNKDGIAAINTALAGRYTKTEADNRFERKGSGGNVNLSDVLNFKRTVKLQAIDNIVDSGIYSVSNPTYSGALLVFNTHSSTGIVQFMKNSYLAEGHWQYRNAIDCTTSRWTEWRTFSNSNDISELEKQLEKQMQQSKEAAVKDADNNCRWMFINILKNGYIRWPGTEHPSKVFSSPAWQWRLIYKVSLEQGSVCEASTGS